MTDSLLRPNPSLPYECSDRDFLDLAVVDQIRAHLGLRGGGEPDDQPLDPGPVRGEVDVGLRWIGRGAGVRVVDGAQLQPVPLDLLDQAQHLASVDLEAQRAGGGVDGAVSAHGPYRERKST